MLRIIAWALLALYLLTVGLWPAAIAPVTATFAGFGAILGAVPTSAWLLAGVITWLRHRPTRTHVTV
ncbi:hypothetical protein [Streptomyces sp. STCH 565 A]|uniref:hypothetical protein n=1 Tax=Streptomyces sp. STCH 565 A TaxID=2950532 RepID=UPI002074ACE0|nr:hypothetical protein [Streptomyces sp. STCH 565 A]MCM8552281.1 hypothetical protein [Streptomyces sp. STCH 565 A]